MNTFCNDFSSLKTATWYSTAVSGIIIPKIHPTYRDILLTTRSSVVLFMGKYTG